jgi:hypothetical protein
MAYAHAVIEYQNEDGEAVRYDRGEAVSTGVPGYDELVDAGSIGEAEPDPVEIQVQAPEEIEVEGVRYVKASDGATNGATSSV